MVFWALFIFSYSLGWLEGKYSLKYFLANYVGDLMIYLIYIYGTLYIAYGYFVPRKKYLISFICYILLLVFATQSTAWLYNNTNDKGASVSILNFLPFYIFLAAFTLSLKIARNSYLSLINEIELKQDLINQKEYFLRSQIHPHFLFNTLNNFYGLALEKSDELPDLMIRLSNILRHQIYNSETSYISLEKEISYLKDYIELEKIRHAQNLSFEFTFPDQVPSNLFIAPAVLIVFFENAFKHSNNISSHLIEIKGYLSIGNEELSFLLENSYPEKAQSAEDKEHGVGLKNVRNRLELLGKDNYTLHTEKKNGRFSVSLKMKLKNR